MLTLVLLCAFESSIELRAGPGTTKKGSSDKSGFVPIIDGMGRKITVKRPVKRIAFSHSATAEALKILDAWDMVVGRCRLEEPGLYQNLDQISVVRSGQNIFELNYEELYSTGAELFLTVDIPVGGFNEMVSNLEPDIPVVALNFHDASQFIVNLEKLGIILGKEKEAEAYIRWFNDIVDRISTKTKSLQDKPRLFLKTGWGEVDEIHTFSDVFPGMRERNEITGCINIAGQLPSQGGWVSAIDSEWLIIQKIDLLIIMDFVPGGFGLDVHDTTLAKNHRRQVMELPAFSGSSAVKTNRVYMMPSNFYATPRFIIQYAYLAKWLHPGLFPGLNPRAIYQEYITRFLRIDYDLSQNGVLVYPED